MKFLIAFLTIIISTNLLSAEKASRGDLLEAFDGKYISFEMRNSLVCFKVDGNKVKVVKHESKCADIEEVSIRRRGAVCVEFPNKERCARVRILSNGDFAMGKRLNPIYIYNNKKKMVGASSEADANNESRLAKKQYKKAIRLYKRKKYYQAFELFKQSAELGYTKSEFRLGYMYAKAKGVDKDENQAKAWYEKAANKGDSSAQFNLGVLLRFDDVDESVKWLKKSANNGNAAAQNNLGVMYKLGHIGGWGNPDEALKWYMMAAEGGNKVGQYNVCAIYYNKGAHKYNEAKIWCERAKNQGYSKASRLLDKMDSW